MDYFSDLFELLFDKLDMQAIGAIIGICYAISLTLKQLEWVTADRLMPLAPLGLGALVSYYRAETDWELWAIYYAGGASVAYNILWTTLLNKVNLFELASDILLKFKNRKTPKGEGL